MKSQWLIIFYLLAFSLHLPAQVAINHDGSDPAAGTILHVKSAAATKPDVVVEDATGYVGLGTLDPQDRLDLWGGARLSLDANNYVRIFGNPAVIAGNTVFEGTATVEGDAIQRYSFLMANASGGYDTIVSLLRPTQSIGIGTNLPKGKVHVRVTPADVQIGNSSIGLEINDFEAWQGIAIGLNPLDSTYHPFIGYGPETKHFGIVQFEDDNHSAPSEARMVFLATGQTGIGDPTTHALPDAALTVSNGPIWHLLGIRGDILSLKDYDGSPRLKVNADGKVSRARTGAADLLPVAYGVVESDGTIVSGTGNFTVNHSDTGEYYIEVTGETIDGTYTIVVTNQEMDAIIAGTTDDNGDAVIYLYDTAGEYTDARFQFIIYRP